MIGMTVKAHVEFDPNRFGIRIAVQRSWDGATEEAELLKWGPPTVTRVHRSMTAPEDAWLPLDEEVGRAMYEALAEHFGHAGHDIRTLRQDYNAERSRVDKMLDALIKRGA